MVRLATITLLNMLLLKKEMLLFYHEYCLKKLTEKGALSSYAEFHRILEDEFDVSVLL